MAFFLHTAHQPQKMDKEFELRVIESATRVSEKTFVSLILVRYRDGSCEDCA
jgi:hypothetical protein